LTTENFTLECWCQTSDLADTICPVSNCYQGRGCWFYNHPARLWSGGLDSAGASYDLPSVTPADTELPGVWTYLVLTHDLSVGTRFYVDGEWDGTQGWHFDRNLAGPLIIGAQGLGAPAAGNPGVDMFFNGVVDEVAVYTYALTQAQITNHYQLALYGNNSKPLFQAQPQPQLVVAGGNASFSAVVQGTLPISVQWLFNGSAIAGATTSTFTVTNAAYTSAGGYQLAATNTVGAATSALAQLSVLPTIRFANATNGLVAHYKFEQDFRDATGRGNDGRPIGSPTFVPGRIGQWALQYLTDTNRGVYNFVYLGFVPDFLVSSNVDFSVSFWVQTTNAELSGDLPFFSSTARSLGQLGMEFAPSFGFGGWYYGLDGLGGSSVGCQGAANSINDGHWHHLLHSFTRAGPGITYLDGVQVDSWPTAAAGDLDVGNPFCIGQDATGSYQQNGLYNLDDFCFWRRALTPAEAYAIWYSGEHFGASVDAYGPVTMTLSQASNGRPLIIWQAGTLLQARSLSGPWTPVPNATPTSYQVPLGAGNMFYRIQL
jgi:hypothetical protein